MGDRFYMQQKDYKPGRILKRDIIPEIHSLLNREIEGLDKLTIKSLTELTEAIKGMKYGKA